MPSQTGYRYLAEALAGYGVTHVFMVPTIAVPALAEMDEIGVEGITAHSEKAAAYMADGYARVRGGPGICMAQTIGAANLASGLRSSHPRPHDVCSRPPSLPGVAVAMGSNDRCRQPGVGNKVGPWARPEGPTARSPLGGRRHRARTESSLRRSRISTEPSGSSTVLDEPLPPLQAG
jgi:hypothetical protein